MTYKFSKKEIEESRYMSLRTTPESVEAKALIQIVEDECRSSSGGKRTRLSSAGRKTVGAIVGDLLKAAESDPTRYSFRHMNSGSFSDGPIGYSSFMSVVKAMKASGLLTVITGDGGGSVEGRLTRFRATLKLLKLAVGAGVRTVGLLNHFASLPRPRAIAAPLALKTSSRWERGIKSLGKHVEIDLARSPACELAKQVNLLNTFFATVSIEPADCHYAFRRTFNEGDDPKFEWDKGGRLYSLGESYQQMNATERQGIKLNGESVVEIDIKASHLTILHALLRVPLDPTCDPYEIGIPRTVVKAWVTMTLGHNQFQRAWSKNTNEKFKEETGMDLQRKHPIRAVRDTVLKHLPVLLRWHKCGLTWADLQYRESQAIIETVQTLAAEHGVPALPVHDSIIVPISSEALARETLSRIFQKHIGVRPVLTTK